MQARAVALDKSVGKAGEQIGQGGERCHGGS
jgi:hypothetical protein